MTSPESADRLHKRLPRKKFMTENGPQIDVSLPSTEWFDEVYGPASFMSTADGRGSESPAGSINLISTNRTNGIKVEIVELESDDEGTTSQPTQNDTAQKNDEGTTMANGKPPTKPTNKIQLDSQPIQTTEEMKKIILSQSELKRLISGYDFDVFRQTIIGCFVRVKLPDLPQIYKNLEFVDQIVDVFEPRSCQHVWLNHRFRLRNFGDTELEKIVETDNDLRTWFTYMEAHGESLPTQGFVKQKDAALKLAFQALSEEREKSGEENEPVIKRENLEKILLSLATLRNLAKLNFELFRQAVVGCFVCMKAIRKHKSDDCQFHIVRVLDCVQGNRTYKVRDQAPINYQLVLPFYGNYMINWVKDPATIITDEGFQTWIEDMRAWKETLPTMDEIRDKATLLQLALSEADKIPTLVDLEKQREHHHGTRKQHKLVVKSAHELNACCLTRPKLEKLAKLKDEAEFAKTVVGCFIRLNPTGRANRFEVDQILHVKFDETKKKADNKFLELKYAGLYSLAALTSITSPFKFSEKEFNEFVERKGQKEETLPTIEFVEKKGALIGELLQKVDASESENQNSIRIYERGTREYRPTSSRTTTMSTRPRSVANLSNPITFVPGKFIVPKARPPQFQNGSFEKVTQSIQNQIISSVRATPGLGPGWDRSEGIMAHQQREHRLSRVIEMNKFDVEAPSSSWLDHNYNYNQKRQQPPLESAQLELQSWQIQPLSGYEQHETHSFGDFNNHYTENTGVNQTAGMPSLMKFTQSNHQDHVYQRSYDMNQFFGRVQNEDSYQHQQGGNLLMSSSSPASRYRSSYNAYLLATKKARLSPQPPPVERFY